MIPFYRHPLVRCTVFTIALFGGLAAFGKNDATAGQPTSRINDMTQQAGQKLDQAASYVDQQTDIARASVEQNFATAASDASNPAATVNIDPAHLASTAQANLHGAASATHAALGKAAGTAGAGLDAAGRKLQQWSGDPAANSAAASGDTSDAQKQMDK